MAIHANSTTAPAVQAGLLPRRDARGRFVKLASVPKSGETPELPPEPLLAADVRHELEALIGGPGLLKFEDTPDAVRRDLDALVADTRSLKSEEPPHAPDLGDRIFADLLTHSPQPVAGEVCPTAGQTVLALHRGAPRGGDIATPSALTTWGHMPMHEPSTAPQARTRHLRRQLEAAAEHGAALLASLGLPRLVGPDFSLSENPIVLGDALDLAIAALDELDGDPDLEDGHDAEHDTAEMEDDETGDDVLDLGEFDDAECEPAWNNAHTADVPAVGYFHG